MANVETKTRKRKKHVGTFGMVWRRLTKDKAAMLGLTVIVILIVCSIFAPILAPYSPTEMDYTAAYCKPCWEHPFGCDKLGRDMLSRVLYGGRYSLLLGFSSALIGAVVGIALGATIGYAGGMVDMIGMRIMDIWSAIPGQLLSILISTTLGSGLGNTILAMSMGGIPGSMRGVRAMCLKERQAEYLEAARSINCSTPTIIFKHMLPNIIAPSIVATTMAISSTIMSAAGLSYIGLGIQPPDPEWGAMLADARGEILFNPHLLIFPGLMIALTALSINLFGDGLRDALDPRLKD